MNAFNYTHLAVFMQGIFGDALYLTFIDYSMYDKINVEIGRAFQPVETWESFRPS